MPLLYYDCFAGISGDMHLGAMMDLGVDRTHVAAELKKLPVHGYELHFSACMRNGISGTRAEVLLHEHTNDIPHHRNYGDIISIIDRSSLSSFVREKSKECFRILAEAESKIHRIDVDKLHFHEVGSVDAIVDIVAAAICIEYLNVDKIQASAVQLGSGMITCAHGIFPVPAPATAEILRGVPVKTGALPFEATTPTGAAILKTFVQKFSNDASFTVMKTGYGIGHKEAEMPNVLRVFLAEENNVTPHDNTEEEAVMLQCNIDDMNPELYDYLFENLFALGAHDVYLSHLIMKKNRPGVELNVLCSEKEKEECKSFVLANTTSLGIREHKVHKSMLARQTEVLQTPYGDVRIKKALLNNKVIRYKAEYEDCKLLAQQYNMGINEIYRIIDRIYENKENR